MTVETAPRPQNDIAIEEVNEELAGLEPEGRIALASEVYAGKLVLPTTFGPTAPVLLKYATDIIPEIPVFTIKHGHETDRTKELAAYYTSEFDLDVTEHIAPNLEVPPEGTPEFSDFQRHIKVEPFQAMLDDLQPHAYLSGVMRWQTPNRQTLPFIQDKGTVVAINPVLDLSEEDVADFFAQTGLPRNDDYYDPTKGVSQQNECQLNTTVWTSQV